MAQSVNLWGATYSDVPALDVPKTGGGTARFTDTTPTTAIESDVASGKVFIKADGSLATGTGSGGGGASNVVTGTFTGTTTGAAMDVTLNYTGSGYPIAVVIYPDGGWAGSTYTSTLQRYAIGFFYGSKCKPAEAPTYPSEDSSSFANTNQMTVVAICKSSISNASSTAAYRATSARTYINQDASESNTNSLLQLQIRSNTKMSVYIANTSYGFMANIEYKYWVIYSS